MRVLALTDSLADTDGVGRYTIRLLRAAQKLDPSLEIEIALARKHPGFSADVPREWNVRVCLPPDYYYYTSAARFHAYTMWSLIKLIPMARRADVIHAIKDFPHSHLALLAARAARKPCIMTAHGTYSVVPLSDPRHARRARASFPRFRRILCVSEYTKNRILQKIKLDNLEVIRNAVDADHYLPRKPLQNRPWTGAEYILGIGALKERKGHHVAVGGYLRIAARHPNLRYFILGHFQNGDPYFENIKKQIRDAGCEGRVSFLGNITEEEKVDILQNARIFVHTPVEAADGGFEGFGIVYLEAAAAGIPSIGTRSSGAMDAIVDGQTGLLVDPEPGDVAAAIADIIENPALAAAMSNGGRTHARAETWERNAARVLEIYKNQAARP